jgi:hypothetical protein
MPPKGEPFSKAKAKASEARPKAKPKAKTKRKSGSKTRKGKKISRKPKRRTSTEFQTRPKKCDCGTHTYTGTEVTPRGFGRCEECIPEHVVLVGRDDKLYRNTGTAWVKV